MPNTTEKEKPRQVLTAELAAKLKSVAANLPDNTDLKTLQLNGKGTIIEGAKFTPEALAWLEVVSTLDDRQRGEINAALEPFNRAHYKLVADLRNMPNADFITKVRGIEGVGTTRYKFLKALFPTPTPTAA